MDAGESRKIWGRQGRIHMSLEWSVRGWSGWRGPVDDRGPQTRLSCPLARYHKTLALNFRLRTPTKQCIIYRSVIGSSHQGIGLSGLKYAGPKAANCSSDNVKSYLICAHSVCNSLSCTMIPQPFLWPRVL